MTQDQRIKQLLLQGETITTLGATKLSPPILSLHRVLTTVRDNNPKLNIASKRIQTTNSHYFEYFVPRRDLIDYLNNN